MRFLGALCVLVVCVAYAHGMLSEEEKKEVVDAAAKCKPKTGATEADVETIMKHEVPETESGKCFLGCMKQHFGIITDDFHVDVDRMKAILAPLKEKKPEIYEKLMEIADECGASASGDNECDVAASLAKCAMEKAESMGLDKSKFQ